MFSKKTEAIRKNQLWPPYPSIYFSVLEDTLPLMLFKNNFSICFLVPLPQLYDTQDPI